MIKSGYKVYDAMTTNPIVIAPDSTVQQAADRMIENKVGSLLIRQNKKLIGIVTERDITRKLVAKNLDASITKITDIMSTQIHTVSPTMDVHDATKLMSDINKRQMPVVDKDELVGMLTMKDVLKIQPKLIGLVYEKWKVREPERKPLFEAGIFNEEHGLEGVCQVCSNYEFSLTDDDGVMTCIDCIETKE